MTMATNTNTMSRDTPANRTGCSPCRGETQNSGARTVCVTGGPVSYDRGMTGDRWSYDRGVTGDRGLMTGG